MLLLGDVSLAIKRWTSQPRFRRSSVSSDAWSGFSSASKRVHPLREIARALGVATVKDLLFAGGDGR